MEWLLMTLVFGGLLAYAGYGAIMGSLYVPSRRGPGTVLSGAPAWSITMGIALIWFGVAVREGLFSLDARPRTTVELVSLGIGLLLALFGPAILR